MKYLIAIIVVALLVGCRTNEDAFAAYLREIAPAEALYFSGTSHDAKAALWTIVRISERDRHREPVQGRQGKTYTWSLALSYSRLAMIAEAEADREKADAYFALALRFYAEIADTSGDHRAKINRRMATWTIDSLELDRPPNWRAELGRPVSIYYPKFEPNAKGEIEEAQTAQPGATDNPDDAQRLREDH